MKYHTLGRSGLKVAPLAVGTFNFGGPSDKLAALEIISIALENGVNLFDTADSYRKGASEQMLGECLAELGRRNDVIIATKVHFPSGPGPNDFGNSRHHIIRSCEESLRRLKSNHIDLLQLHRPSFDIPIDETLGALTDLVRQGKVRYVGTSTHPGWKVMEAVMVAKMGAFVRIVSEQPPYNLLDRRIENELVPLSLAEGIGLLPYAPLAQGVLSGRYDGSSFPKDSRASLLGGVYADRVNAAGVAVGRRVSELAAQVGMTPSQLALLWVSRQPAVTAPIFGPRTPEQMKDAARILALELPADICPAFDALVPPGSAVTNFHNGCTWMKQRIMVGLPANKQDPQS